MKLNILLAAGLLFTLLAACNLPGSQPDLPDAPQEIAPTEPSEDVIMSTENPVDAVRDACLEGNWMMDTADLDLLVSVLVELQNMRVPEGSLTLRFDPDGSITYNGELTIQIDFAENWYMQGVGGFSNTGTYATDGNLILFDIQTAEVEVFVWRAYKDGQSVEQPGGGPEFSLTLPGAAPYRCTTETLEIVTVNTVGDTITMFFSR